MTAVPRISMWPPLTFKPYVREPAKKLPFPLEEPGCRIFSLARQGLFMGIKALGLGPGDEVLVPSYHHGSEIEAFVRAGVVCRFYEVGEGLEPDEKDLARLLGPRVKALHLIHYLGFPQATARWRAWCDGHDLRLIEDAAQAWLSSTGGTPVGSHGDLSMFCLYKTFGLPDGAAVVTDFPLDIPPLRRGMGVVPVALQHGLYLAQKSGWFAAIGRRLRRAAERDPETGSASEREFALGDPERSPFAATSFLLERVAHPAAQSTRATNYSLLLERLKPYVPRPFADLPEGASPFAFPIKSDRKKETIHRLSQRGIAAVNFWAIPHPHLPVADFPRAMELRDSVIALPVHQELSAQNLEQIGDAALAALQTP